MDWQGLSRRFSADHPHEPQVLGRLEVALNQAREALQMMAGHGYRFHLADGAGQPHPAWPRKLYHVNLSPNGRLVYTEQEAEELGAGWFDSLLRAQLWDGMETQFNGRGGIPKSPRVPAPIYGSGLYISAEEAERISELADFVREFKLKNKWENTNSTSENGALLAPPKPDLGKESEIAGV